MRRFPIALTLLAVAAPAARAQTHYRVAWWDAAAIATAGVLAVIPQAADLPHGPPPCAPCDPASLPGLDRAALHTFSGSAGTVSTALLAGVVGFAGLASLDGASGVQRRGHAVVFAHALAWTVATADWLKVLAHRSRPVLYTAAAPAVASQTDNRRSFPSEHASVAFAAATAYVVMARREQLPHRTRNAVLLYAGALGVAALRVAAGRHFPTDVAGGAALGSSVGWLAATLHASAP
ncbi:MAG TPA: phosphatase PAP2 family protein [Gemmatimonadales bacterium]|jgi:undecaprenyl-diphosphatase|nr:phosphatase PAP2 family protein [Gemmatimonadales bacterium]